MDFTESSKWSYTSFWGVPRGGESIGRLGEGDCSKGQTDDFGETVGDKSTGGRVAVDLLKRERGVARGRTERNEDSS